MTDSSMAPQARPPEPDVAEIVSFLRRFAELMSNGSNAAYLQRAGDLLETLTAREVAASGDGELWRSRHEALRGHAEALESECDALRHDIDGHLEITASVIRERDAAGVALQAREAELSRLREAFAAKLKASEVAIAGLEAAIEARGEECEQLRRAVERERQDGAANLAARDAESSGLRLAFEREHAGLRVQLKVVDDEFAAFRAVAGREQGALRARIASLEAKPSKPVAAQRSERTSAIGEADAVVPKLALRQARDQFEYLARQFVPLGDIASQVMCELGAYNMDLTLRAGQRIGDLPVGEVALSILAPAGPAETAEPRAT